MNEDEKRKEKEEPEAGQEEGGEKRGRIWWHQPLGLDWREERQTMRPHSQQD